MLTGISIYPGLNNSLDENVNLITIAAKSGCTRIFTSLHIPEASYSRLQNEFNTISAAAAAHQMDIISDVSPRTLEFLNIDELDFTSLAALGVKTARLDYGYPPEDIADFTHNSAGIKIQLNASTITAEFLQALRGAQADFRQIDALHNFYPRPGTGLSERFFQQKNALLHAFGIRTGAFLPSFKRPRLPLQAGLPTLEIHRTMSVELSARHLNALGCDTVFIGDCLPTADELTAINSTKSGTVELTIQLQTDDAAVRSLLGHTFTTRADEAQCSFRAQESRELLADITIAPHNTTSIQRGSVTLDNSDYGRYKGELQISKTDQTADDRVNVIGQIPPTELFMLNYLQPEGKFRFKNII